MAGQRRCLVADALHHVAIGRDDPGAVIHQRLAEARRHVAFGDRHADGGPEALTQRAGRGFDRRMRPVFRMTGGRRVQLPKSPDIVDRHPVMAGQVDQRIQQHRTVTGRQDEPVAVGPARIGRIEFVKPGPQRGRDVGHAHRQARMPGFRLFGRIDRQRADRIRHAACLSHRTRQNVGLNSQGWMVGRQCGCSGHSHSLVQRDRRRGVARQPRGRRKGAD